jgi:hypothetical protein
VFADQVTVGHSGNEIAHGAMQAVAFDSLYRGAAEMRRIVDIRLENSRQQLAGAPV